MASRPGIGVPQLLLAITASWAILATPLMADVVKIPVSEQAGYLQDMERPQRGQTMASVEEKFGAPVSKHGPVGEPPISSWEYDNYTVYFESDRVLHSVLKHTPVATGN